MPPISVPGTSQASSLWGVNYINQSPQDEVANDIANEGVNPKWSNILITPMTQSGAGNTTGLDNNSAATNGNSVLGFVENNIGNFGIRIALVILGLILVFVALSSLSKQNITVQK